MNRVSDPPRLCTVVGANINIEKWPSTTVKPYDLHGLQVLGHRIDLAEAITARPHWQRIRKHGAPPSATPKNADKPADMPIRAQFRSGAPLYPRTCQVRKITTFKPAAVVHGGVRNCRTACRLVASRRRMRIMLKHPTAVTRTASLQDQCAYYGGTSRGN